MGKRAENKVHVGLYVDIRVRDKLDAQARIWGFDNRSQVILRLLSYGVGELDRLSARGRNADGV